MNNIPKVSSITYVKDGAEYIEQCIRSVMNQTLRDIEIIIVDGGSTDGTIEIVRKLMQEDRRIEFYINNKGVGAQFNEGLKNAKGEYVAVCEGDDFILPDKYEKQYEIAKNNNIDVLRACYDLYFVCNGKEFRYKVEVASDDCYDRPVLKEEYRDKFIEQFVNGYWNGLYSRRFLIENRIFQNETPGASFQDITFSFLTQLYAQRIWFMQESMHCYRIDNPNASVNSSKTIERLNREYNLLAEVLKKRNLWSDYKRYFFVWEIYSCKQFGDRCPQRDKKFYINTYFDNLSSQSIENSFANINVYHKARLILDAFYKGREEFERVMCIKDDLYSKMYSFFTKSNLEGTERIAIFGAGHLGIIIYDFLNLCGKKPVFLDNDCSKYISKVKCAEVLRPDFLSDFENYTVIIASAEHYLEMKRQLISIGYDQNKIIICENEDLFLREVFMNGFLFKSKQR